MAVLFTELLGRLGPSKLAARLNITQRTARQLRFAPLSRFPRITRNARVLTKQIKTNVLIRAGASATEASRHVNKEFGAVDSIRDRLTALVDTISINSSEFKAHRLGLSTQEYISAFPDDFRDLRASVRAGIRVTDKKLTPMERDST